MIDFERPRFDPSVRFRLSLPSLAFPESIVIEPSLSVPPSDISCDKRLGNNEYACSETIHCGTHRANFLSVCQRGRLSGLLYSFLRLELLG